MRRLNRVARRGRSRPAAPSISDPSGHPIHAHPRNEDRHLPLVQPQCGRGLSWQIVPSALDRMLRDPERSDRVMAALLQMVKLDIAQLEQAYRSS